MKGIYIGFAVAAALITVGLYLSKRKNNENLVQEIVDEIEFDKIIEFFKGKVTVLDPSVKAVGFRISKIPDLKKYNLSSLEGKEGVLLTFYNESSSTIDSINSKVLISSKLDRQTQDAFGDKEMIIFN
ncbi:hypothetical protein [Winogradskyella undariae]|uniref:hypothetical protein n=1 Tax=Winogradskyella undariae TaxID=1285465 RepID=UPI0015CBA82B|nr:hypothetical protein [Winogradskyella undariae]